MKQLSIDHPESISEALDLVKEGQVIAFPTDTVYGIGGSAFNSQAVDRLYQIKQRDYSKAIPVLIGTASDLHKIVSRVPAGVEDLIQVFWPGALTLILPIKSNLPDNLSPGHTIGVRQPDLEFARRLLNETGPMAVSSANLSGQPSARTAQEVKAQLNREVDLILDGGKTPGSTASTVLDCTGETWRILRQGPVTLAEIQAAVGP